jgi:t-SNARE complex subunit (syntaxin)
LDVDPDLIEVYISEAENAKTLIKALEKFIASINDVVRDMPTAVRTYHGYELGGRN